MRRSQGGQCSGEGAWKGEGEIARRRVRFRLRETKKEDLHGREKRPDTGMANEKLQYWIVYV